MSAIRLLIVDDHPLVVDGLSSRLSSCDDIDVVGVAENGEEAIEKTDELKPDVVLMDINMPIMNGIDAAEIFNEKYKHVKVLILSMHDDKEYVTNALRSGAKGYILKTVSSEEMINAVRSVFNGGIYYSPAVSEILLSKDTDENEILTSREQTVISLVAKGLSSKKIASQLDISVRTVETHRRNVNKKLNISSTSALVRYAIEHGLGGD